MISTEERLVQSVYRTIEPNSLGDYDKYFSIEEPLVQSV